MFDEVDKKYGIPEEDRKKLEAAAMAAPPAEGAVPGGGGGGGGSSMSSSPLGGEPSEAAGTPAGATAGAPAGVPPSTPLSETISNKDKILSMLNEDTSLPDLFNMKKAQKNIYEIDKAINDILNQ